MLAREVLANLGVDNAVDGDLTSFNPCDGTEIGRVRLMAPEAGGVPATFDADLY